MARRDLFRRNAPQVKERKAEGWRQERGLQVHGDHDGHPFGIERTAIDHRSHDGHHDVDDFEEIEHEAQHEKHQHHDQEDLELVVKALEELLDVMLPAERDHHEVQKLRCDQDGKDHTGDLRRLAHRRAENAGLVQDPAAVKQTEEGVEIRRIRRKEADPAFGADIFKVDPQVKVDADQDHDRHREGGIDDDLAGFVLFLELTIRCQHDRTRRTESRSRRRIGDAAKDRAKNGDNQNQWWEHDADQLVLGQQLDRVCRPP